MHYVPLRPLPGFPSAYRVRSKTPYPGGLRARWKVPSGHILEWDYLHGRVEMYDRRGNHVGEFDATTGHQIKGPDSSKSVTP